MTIAVSRISNTTRPSVPGGRQVAPLTMPLGSEIYSFPALARQTFHGLPGLLADSLPDRFGNALIDAWLARQGRAPGDFNAVERLCYIGARGMGALEFVPATGPTYRSARVDVAALVDLAGEILTRRAALGGSLAPARREQALQDILRVGTSAGGARAKAVIAWNPETNEVRSGQIKAGDGFSHWLIKFDGVAGNRDRELDDPRGYGLIEYAYHTMARAAGIQMTECRTLEENGRHHFMTRRFDRTGYGRQDPHAVVGRRGPLRLQPGKCVLPASRPCASSTGSGSARTRPNSNSGAWPSTSSPATRTITSRTSPF